MTVEDIFSQLIAHAIQGLMVHAQMSEYYDFLGLKGYAKCHEYHYFIESCNYRDLCDYYIKHYNKLPKETPFDNPNVIPEDWYKYTRQDVDAATRKNSISNGLIKWMNWEQSTKDLSQRMYIELMAIGEVAAAKEVEKTIRAVDKELAEARQKYVCKKAIDYNISSIMSEQDELCKNYKKKLDNIKLC